MIPALLHPIHILLLLALLTLLPGRAGMQAAGLPGADQPPAPLRVEVLSPQPVLAATTTATGTFVAVQMAGWPRGGPPGAPDLPRYTRLIALPPGATAAVRVVEQQSRSLPLASPPLPNPTPSLAGDDAQGLPVLGPARYDPHPAYYQKPLYPDRLAWLDAPFDWRGLRVARLTVAPLQFDPVHTQLLYHSRLLVEVTFQPGPPRQAAAPPPDPLFDATVRSLLLNGDEALTWRSAPLPAPRPRLAETQPWLKISVRWSGPHLLTCAHLAQAGVDLASLDLATVRLFAGRRDGPEIALKIEDGGQSAPCDGDDRLLFWVGDDQNADFTEEADSRRPPIRTNPPKPFDRASTLRQGFDRLNPPAQESAGSTDQIRTPPCKSVDIRDNPCPFFGSEAGDSRYSHLAVYWLTYGGAAGRRMAERPALSSGAPVTASAALLTLAEKRFYQPQLPREEGYEHWFWRMHSTNRPYWPASRAYTLSLESGVTARSLTVALAGDANSHRTRFFANGLPLGEVTWRGAVAYTPTLSLPAGALTPGANVITITEAAAGPSLVAVQSIAIGLERPLRALDNRLDFAAPGPGSWRFQADGFDDPPGLLWDVSDPYAPVVITGFTLGSLPPDGLSFGDETGAPARYVAAGLSALLSPAALDPYTPSHLDDPANGADYLLIAPASLLPALTPLAAWRTGQGLRVKVVDAQTIYDDFGRGLPEPPAIRAFLAYAYHNWQPPAPLYVLLVGDGHYDPKGYCLAPGECDNGRVTPPGANLLPPNLELVDPWLGETAADNRLAIFDPANPLPQMAVGRLPAASAEETAALVTKILAYEQQPGNEAWRSRLAFVADNAFDAQGKPDPAGNFWQLSDRIADDPTLTRPGFSAERYYLNICDPQGYPHCALADPPYTPYTGGPAITDGLAAAFNSGHFLVNYIGHGRIAGWGGAPSMLDVKDLTRLSNRERLPLILDMTCYTGYYQRPDLALASLAESLVRKPDGGAIAAWSSTGLGLVDGHDLLNGGFLQALMQGGVRRAGLAALAGLASLYVQGGGAHLENIDTFLLLGDPALRLALPGDGQIYLPLITDSE